MSHVRNILHAADLLHGVHRAGDPAARIALAGKFRLTHELAPTTVDAPTVTPGNTVQWAANPGILFDHNW